MNEIKKPTCLLFQKHCSVSFWLLMFVVCQVFTARELCASDKEPVILIVFDDLFDVFENREKFGIPIQTPNFDRLAARSVYFENAYAPVAVCNASRTATLTGMSQFRTGVHDTTTFQWNDVVASNSTLITAMSDAGYETMGCGKVFHDSGNSLNRSTYTEIYDHFFAPPPPYVSLPSDRISNPLAAGEILRDDLNTNWAAARIRNYAASDAPFFLTLGIIRPHRPFIVPQEFFDLYPQSEIQLAENTEADLEDVSEFYKLFRLNQYEDFLESNDWKTDFVQGYMAATTFADSKLGEILDEVDANPALNNATIIVWSDNGYEHGEKQSWNKFTMWENSANVPLFVASPDLPKGVVNETPVSLLDIYPTCLSAANAAIPMLVDGNDLFDVVDNPADYSDEVALTSMMGSLSIRTSQYRFIVYNDGSQELYFLPTDPAQRTNLASDPASAVVLQSLLMQLESKVNQMGGNFAPFESENTGTEFNDTLVVMGTQTGTGGTGDDTYFITDGAHVAEAVDSGFDTVYFADDTITIPDNVEVAISHNFSNGFPFNVTGNGLHNRIVIRTAPSTVRGMGGNDIIEMRGARHSVYGNAGDDLVINRGNESTIVGGAGRDLLIAGGRDDLIWGGEVDADTEEDDDLIIADGLLVDNVQNISFDLSFDISRSVPFRLNSTELPLARFETQIIELGQRFPEFVVPDDLGENDTIEAGGGDDFVFSQGGNDIVNAGSGNDHVFGAFGDDQINGNDGRDELDGGPGNDIIDGGNGVDTIYGRDDDDEINGRQGADTIFCGNGNDLAYGDSGSDFLNGGSGNDVMFGGTGHDEMLGKAGNDELSGANGSDRLDGGSGADILRGGKGEDYLIGGTGNDSLVGGAGDDQFVFPLNAGQDTVEDFSSNHDVVLIETGSPLHGLSEALILSQYVSTAGADTIITSTNRILRLKNVAPNDLVGRIQFAN